jgi:phosphoglycolate phosphatase-like HAD superfamily hydrolase
VQGRALRRPHRFGLVRLQAAGLPDTPEQHHRFRENYIPLLAEEIQHPGTGHKGLMPGARELLEALGDHDHLHLALLTGNYRDAAEIKLQHFEIWDFFEWGAFSDDAADRNALVPIARSRAEIYDIPEEAIERVIRSATRRTTSNAPASPAPDRSPWRPAVIRSSS